jgi:hypothetical protein
MSLKEHASPVQSMNYLCVCLPLAALSPATVARAANPCTQRASGALLALVERYNALLLQWPARQETFHRLVERMKVHVAMACEELHATSIIKKMKAMFQTQTRQLRFETKPMMSPFIMRLRNENQVPSRNSVAKIRLDNKTRNPCF